MKKSIFAKMGAATVVLTLITASLVGGTFAKYTTTKTGTGTAAVAKWAIVMKEGTNELTGDTFTFDLANTSTTAVTAGGKIAPGSEGKIDLSINGTGSEVGYSYTIEADTSGLNNVPIKFYSDAAHTTPIAMTGNKATLVTKTDVALANVGTENAKTVYWAWDSASTDAADTPLGTAATSGTFTITMTAEQLITTAP